MALVPPWPKTSGRGVTARKEGFIDMLEHEITEQKLKAKMLAAQDSKYPQADPAPPIEVAIFGE
ncbi:hypothetical protein MJO28_006155 [Puccinia striiformis f. sp. tritici]|uniref:Uncharacterized protein n=2 Tax=Puccinia striiformis f. sp. tritici TaxID=168172 RepID=A0A0L0UQI4_9BASI|nr:hypothetical protein MJO28_006155 [Puccinia striiformis f. sp. tritici]KAI9609095.1 hypothetical protein KEM48_003014 [Puccinia striiformis f. sp. tritici PST-130]KNE89298.1 hypothetical protein PSTG_17243 [Puccinia striiformis f. sp. tritici PST-78]